MTALLTETQVRQYIKKYFSIKELVDNRTAVKYGDRAWRFLDFRLLYAMLIIRTNISHDGKDDLMITVNRRGLQQRGLRTNVQPMIQKKNRKNKLYLSAHMFGKAFDFDVEGMTAQEVRDWIVAHAWLFPFKIRLEEDGDRITWVHLDVIYEEKNPAVYKFIP